MSILLLISAALVVAPGGGPLPPDGLPSDTSGVALPPLGSREPALFGKARPGPGTPVAAKPVETVPPLLPAPPETTLQKEVPAPQPTVPKPVEINATLLPSPPAVQPSPAASAAETSSPDRWALMRELQGTLYGKFLDDNRLFVNGWLEGTYNASSSAQTNAPVAWTDRANKPLLQQGWLRIGRSLATSGTEDISFGFQIDTLIGSDYRFTLPRGLFNSQLVNSQGNQNLYGVDPIQHYVSAYVPTLFQGTEFRVGRLYTPWGVDSLEAVSTPLVTRSYAFNSAPPFTHCGVGMYTTFNPVWSGTFMAVNGNDVYFGDPSAEWRFVGSLKWTQPGGKNTVQVSTSAGRGKFNAGDTFAPATAALSNEAAGRNNINVFDLIWTHQFNSVLAYNVEAIYGYQTNVPGLTNAAGGGTAHWLSVAHYLFYTISPRLTAAARFETFDDFDGQRTGFEGLYTAFTLGMAYKAMQGLILRPELRYDHNSETRPFEGRHGQFVALMDVILRF